VPFRLEMARRLGADHVIGAGEDVLATLKVLNEGRGADVVIVTAGSIKAMEYGLNLADGGATVLLFGVSAPEETLPVSPYHLLFSEITLVGTYSCSHIETRQALKLIQGGRIEVESLITHRFNLAEVDRAIRLAAEHGESMKILVTP
jgi:threonine dehydrogenase-like Zn-dependent dehydrogenase